MNIRRALLEELALVESIIEGLKMIPKHPRWDLETSMERMKELIGVVDLTPPEPPTEDETG